VQTEASAERPPAALDDPPVFLSLIIPAHDEERRLPATFDRIREYLDRQPYRAEVLVVENASSDRTWEIANDAAARDSRFRVLREPIRGKGAAVKRGMLAARGEYRFLCDADLSMPIAEVESFLPPRLGNADVAIGSREAEGAVRYEEPGRRHLMGRMFNGLIRLLLIPDIQDTQCGFKCFRAEAAEAIFSRTTRTGFSFDVESLVLSRRLDFRIREVPVHWYYDPDSRVRIVRDSASMIFDVLAIWLRLRLGRYESRRSPTMRESIGR
jgi:glycosyltransferase involved in cell wall biosynthesis